MPSVRFFTKCFSGKIRKAEPANDDRAFFGGMAFLEPKDHYEGRRIYLVGAGDAVPADATADDKGTFIYCDGQDGPHPANATAFYLDERLPRVFNRLEEIRNRTGEWRRALWDLDGKVEFQTVVQTAAELGECPAAMINENGKIICSAHLKQSGNLSESPPGSLPPDIMTQRIAKTLIGSKRPAMEFKTELGTVIFCHLITHPDGLCSIMLMEDIDGEEDIEELVRIAARRLDAIPRSVSLRVVHDEMRQFSRCWEDIMDLKITTSVAVRDAISRLPHKVEDFVSIGVITFPDRKGKIPYRNILLQLRRFLPDVNIALYQRDIVVMLSRKERTFRPDFENVDVAELSSFLIDNGAMMAITSKTRRVDALPTLYQLGKSTALIAAALNDSVAQSHIVYYEDYSIYCIIDMAVKHYLQDPSNYDVVYLVHSAIIQLTRYDREHNTNLRDVLYHYLVCDRNLVKTAAATFMHRNTVLNKINKITSLLQLDLEDPRLRQKLILSCQVILYIERVMNSSLKL